MEYTTKACTACKTWQPESGYSGAQLKKQGKRTCKACVTKANPPLIPKAPPLSIAADDRITAEEIHSTLPCLMAQVVGLGVHAVAPPELQPSSFTTICEIYPPSHNFAWWSASDASVTARAKLRISVFTSAMAWLVEWASAAYKCRAIADATMESFTTPLQQRGLSSFFSPPVYRGRSIFEDESRLIHKMIVHWIYFVRHFPFACKAEEQRLYDDTSHQHYGQKRVNKSERDAELVQ